jgi:CRISPR-associated endonuclease/helicase Cas3
MTDALGHVLAKSGRNGRPAETLSQHTAAVLQRLADWRHRYPRLPRHTGRPDLWSLVAWACLLHDIGKTARGFQAMLAGGPRFLHRHEALSLVAVGWLDISEETRGLVAAGVATHHKDVDVIRESYPFDTPQRELLLAELSEADEAAWQAWLSGAGAPDLARWGFAPLPGLCRLERRRALDRAFRALVLLSDAIGTGPADGELALTARAVRGLVLLADHAGSAHEVLPPASALSSVASFRESAAPMLTRPLEPHQEAAARVVGHLILVAPTGSGKTEAALLWAARQRESADGRPVVFYVLPYRASLNAMRARIPRYGLQNGEVVLQHSAATAALYRYALDNKGYTAAEAERAARAEAALARLMTAPVRVLTPYQLLRAFFGLPGHEAMLSDAAGGIFILDELHAYDLARLSMVLASVRHLARDLGCRFLAMSATFPTVLKRALGGVLGGAIAEVDADPATLSRFRRHVLRIRERDLLSVETVAEIERRHAAGEAVLVVATTVGRAQALFDRLRGSVEDVTLLHGRFTGRDRARKESRLAERVGTRHRGGNAPVLVATQVVEVSLDLDFDVLFTDPAPLEALIQRFGRVNRGCRGGLRDVIVHTALPAAGSFVYADHAVQSALAILRDFHDTAIEESDIAKWVDMAYADGAERWREELLRRVEDITATVIRVNRPLNSHPELREAFDRLFDGFEVVPAALAQEYSTLVERAPLQAPALRVPISWRQRQRLISAGQLARDGEIADVPYDEIRGLDLTFRDDGA